MKIKFKNSNFTKKRKIIILEIVLMLVLILLILTITLLLKQPSKSTISSTEQLEFINDDTLRDDSYRSPDNIIIFGENYEGNFSTAALKKSMYYVVTEVLPTYYSELKDASYDEIVKYYEKEKESIYIDLAMDTETKFVNLVYGLQELSGDSIIWESYRIDVDSIKVGNSYTKAVLYIAYEGNDELALNIKVKNKVSSDCSSVVYTINND